MISLASFPVVFVVFIAAIDWVQSDYTPLFRDWTNPDRASSYYGCGRTRSSAHSSSEYERRMTASRDKSRANSEEEERSGEKDDAEDRRRNGNPCGRRRIRPSGDGERESRPRGDYGPFGAGLFGLLRGSSDSTSGLGPADYLRGLFFGGRR